MKTLNEIKGVSTTRNEITLPNGDVILVTTCGGHAADIARDINQLVATESGNAGPVGNSSLITGALHVEEPLLIPGTMDPAAATVDEAGGDEPDQEEVTGNEVDPDIPLMPRLTFNKPKGQVQDQGATSNGEECLTMPTMNFSKRKVA